MISLSTEVKDIHDYPPLFRHSKYGKLLIVVPYNNWGIKWATLKREIQALRLDDGVTSRSGMHTRVPAFNC
jgi:hypothetical protein